MHFVVIPALTAVDSILSAQGNNALPSHYALSLGFVICLGKSQSIVRMSFRRLAIAMQQVGTGLCLRDHHCKLVCQQWGKTVDPVLFTQCLA